MPVDASDQRRFAGARRSADHHTLASRHLQGDVTQRVEGAVPFVDALHVDVKHGSSVIGARRQHVLEMPAVAGHRVAEGEIDGGDEQIDLDAEPDPLRIDDDRFAGAQQIEQPDRPRPATCP